MKKLFTVTAKFEYVVAAEDLVDAIGIAEDVVFDAAHDLSRDDLVQSVFPYRNDVKGWDGECIPYGSDDDKRTHEYENE